MKLDKDLKEKIDRYFDNISADELYGILTGKYNFPEEGINMLVVKDGYPCQEDEISEIVTGDMSYADVVVKQEIEVVRMKFLEDTSDSQNEESSGYDSHSSIPLAA